MSDSLQAALWVTALIASLLLCVALRRAGMGATYVRDLLHVGAGVWVFGWPYWRSPMAPVALALAATGALLLVPVLTPRMGLVARFRESVSGGEEGWTGLVLYAGSFAWMTWFALRSRPFPAAAALLALALGDGIGGALGRRFGRHFFAAPGGKRKSLEGSVAVAVAAAIGAWIASAYFRVPAPIWHLVGIGLTASAAEAVAPKATDNVLVPAAVWLFVLAIA